MVRRKAAPPLAAVTGSGVATVLAVALTSGPRRGDARVRSGVTDGSLITQQGLVDLLEREELDVIVARVDAPAHADDGLLAPTWIRTAGPRTAVLVLPQAKAPRRVRLLGPGRSRDPLESLTERERDVLAAVAEGLSNEAVARRLRLSERTVETHVTAVFTKLGLAEAPGSNRRVLAVLAYLRQGQPA
jgi:DNA-binding CsgD family transcriptional regulator